MLNESVFHPLADEMLENLMEMLEKADSADVLEMDVQNGILTIERPDGRIFLISKHALSRQLWLSSPFSGGLHFAYNGTRWALPDGQELAALLRKEVIE